MFECFHCLSRGVIWDCDYSFEDFGYEGEGIVQICHCANCGAEIEYRIPIIKEEEEPMTRREHMQAARVKAGMTQRELAEKSGVHRVTVARLECGDRLGRIDTLELLADALGISIDEYVGHKVVSHV